MDEGQNAIIDLSPVNASLENLFLVFILSNTLFIPLKQTLSQKKQKQHKKSKQTKTQNNENQPTKKIPQKAKQKNPHQNQKQICKDNFCSLSFI